MDSRGGSGMSIDELELEGRQRVLTLGCPARVFMLMQVVTLILLVARAVGL